MTCSNGVIDQGEDCDGTEFADETCSTLLGGLGTLRCSSTCRFDTTGCSNDTSTILCNNLTLDAGEECDGTKLNSATCISLGLGFTGGTLRCYSTTCKYDTSSCTTTPAGNSDCRTLGCTNSGDICVSQVSGLPTCVKGCPTSSCGTINETCVTVKGYVASNTTETNVNACKSCVTGTQSCSTGTVCTAETTTTIPYLVDVTASCACSDTAVLGGIGWESIGNSGCMGGVNEDVTSGPQTIAAKPTLVIRNVPGSTTPEFLVMWQNTSGVYASVWDANALQWEPAGNTASSTTVFQNGGPNTFANPQLALYDSNGQRYLTTLNLYDNNTGQTHVIVSEYNESLWKEHGINTAFPNNRSNEPPGISNINGTMSDQAIAVDALTSQKAVVFKSVRLGYTDDEISGRIYDPSNNKWSEMGTGLGKVNIGMTGKVYAPAIAYHRREGYYYVAWVQENGAGSNALYARKNTGYGSTWYAAANNSDTTTGLGYSYQARTPVIGVDDNDNVILAWSENGSIFVKKVNPYDSSPYFFGFLPGTTTALVGDGVEPSMWIQGKDIYLAWQSGSVPEIMVKYYDFVDAKWNSLGDSTGTSGISNSSNVPSSLPTIVVWEESSSGGRSVCVSWEEMVQTNSPDVMVRCYEH